MLKTFLFIAITLAGFIDASYLTYEHYSHYLPPCSTNILFVDCGKVLTSQYSLVFGIPLAAIGMVHYALVLLFYRPKTAYLLILETLIGFLASLYFIFLQLVVIKSICLYCMLSAAISTTLFILAVIFFPTHRKRLTLGLIHLLYVYILKPFLFLLDPELVHVSLVRFGELVGNIPLGLTEKLPQLEQTFAGINFPFPVGLAAGFDYEARLTRSLSPWGFGFQSVGTITNSAYGGNPRPMLGRLPKSKSLMVNKGFKNLGATTTATRLAQLSFPIPIGISIGRTNSLSLTTQSASIADIISAFQHFEMAAVSNAYYELNISCPNLYGTITFYPPKNLDQLLTAVDKLKLTKPLFIKMPIDQTDAQVLAMLKVIAQHSPLGVIFGNLQKDRTNKALDQTEVAKFPVGNFSGKPTFARSNELIRLTYKHYAKRFVIIGCGGIFSAQDAYTKIQLGASLVQLITGMVYEGPSLIMQINFGLVDLLRQEGLTHISQAIGKKA